MQGNDIYAKVIAINQFGDSLISPDGAGAKVVVTPDAPTLFTRDYDNSDMATIAFSWSIVNDGGTPVIDYQIEFDQSTGEWLLLAQNFVGDSY